MRMVGGRQVGRAFGYSFVSIALFACGSTASSPSFPDGGAPSHGQTGVDATTKKGPTTTLKQGDAGGGQCSTGSSNQEGCGCTLGKTVSCYSGPASTRNVGPCHDGQQKCQSSGEFPQYGPCVGEVDPTAANSCVVVAVPDAAPPPPPPPAVDAGHDSGMGMVAVGEACTPGQSVVQGMYPCGGSITECGGGVGCECNDAGPSMPQNEVLYCDTSGVYQMFPAGSCTPASCMACLETSGCAAMVPPAPDPCNGPATTALTWLGSCGPDRSNYFQMLADSCPVVQDIESCKDGCTGGGTSGGACSIW